MIGHDWGSYTAGRFALWHPERLLALVMYVFFFGIFDDLVLLI